VEVLRRSLGCLTIHLVRTNFSVHCGSSRAAGHEHPAADSWAGFGNTPVSGRSVSFGGARQPGTGAALRPSRKTVGPIGVQSYRLNSPPSRGQATFGYQA